MWGDVVSFMCLPNTFVVYVSFHHCVQVMPLLKLLSSMMVGWRAVLSVRANTVCYLPTTCKRCEATLTITAYDPSLP